MAYFTLLWKARTIEKYRLNYEREKLNSISLTTAQNPKKTLYQKWCNYNLRTKKRLSNAFLSRYPEGSRVYNIISYLRLDQTFPNFILKSAVGFLAGIILTYLCFMFFVFQLSISLIHATIVSSIIGVLLTLGLAFSYRIRCLVFLLIPQFFSRVGRYTLTCYALVLILTGPATNTLKNSEVLSESLACSQEQIKINMAQVNESVQKPFISMRGSIKMLIKSLERLATKLKLLVVRMQRLVLSLAHSLQSGYSWLKSTAANCNKKLGTPYDRCSASISTAIVECQAALGPKFSSFCNAAKITDAVCWPVVSLKSFCRVIDFVNGNILGVVNRKLKIFTERINTMLQLEVHIHHSYSFTSNSSKSGSLAAAGIVTEIRNRADPLLTWLSWSSCITSLSLLLIIFRAKYYQHMFETRSRFDNRYVTKQLRDLDLKRFKQGKETVLPLNRREQGKYINTTSFHLVSSERVHLSKSIVTLAITTFKLMIHMVADYSLYWVLTTIRYHGTLQTPLQSGFQPSAYVSGSGLVSKIMKSLISSITLPLTSSPSSPTTCLPNPHPPDLQRYSQIGILIVLLWFFALFEPYGLRLRHVIMGLYRPERAKTRAIWLYNHIKRTRGGFMKFARRKLHREYKYSSEEKHTLRYWLDSHIPCLCIKDILGISKGFSRCSLCGVIESCNQCDAVLVRCETPKCPGIYCSKCFSDIGLLCTICLSPEDYGDMSDVSLEKGSSDSESEDSQDGYVPSKFTTKNKQVMFAMEEGRCVSPDERNNQNKSSSFGKNVNNDRESKNSTFKEGGIKSKLIVERVNKPNRKFTDFIVADGRRKEITSVGQDAMCINYDKVFDCYTKDMVYVVSSQFKDTNYGRYRKYCNATLNTNDKRGRNYRQAYYFRQFEQNKGTNISESNKTLLQRLQNSRKYTVNFSLSRSIKDYIDSSKTFTLKLDIKRKRSKSRKKKKTLKFSDLHISSAEIVPRQDLQSNRFITKRTLKYQSKNRKYRQFKVLSEKVQNLVLKLRRRRILWQLSSKPVSKAGNDRQLENKTIKNCDITLQSPKEIAKKSEKSKQKNIGQEPFKKKLAEQNATTLKKTNNSIEVKGENEINELHKESDGRNYLNCFGCTIFANFLRKKEFATDHEKTNHKKRKKPENNMNTSRKNKKDNEANRKYRISSYLSEQDWIKKHFKSEIQFTKIKKLVESRANDLDAKQIVKDVLTNECTKSNKKNNNYEKEVVVIHKNVNAVMPEKYSDYSPMLNSRSFDCGLPRSMKYFGDLGHHDFDHKHGIANTENACHDYLSTKGPSDRGGACNDPNANEDAVRTIDRDPSQAITKEVKTFGKLKPEPEKISNKNITDPKPSTDEKSKRKGKFKQSMNPLSILFSCFANRKKYQKKKADAIVEVTPTVKNCSCQYDIKEISKENTTKVFVSKDAGQSMTPDLFREVHVGNITCTCATQYDKQCKDAICSCCKSKIKQRSNVKQTANKDGNNKSKANKLKEKKNTATLHELYCKHFGNIGIQCKLERHYSNTPKFKEKSTSSEISLSLDSDISLSTIRSDDTKTDTTVYNMRDVKYTMKSSSKKKPVKVMITAKANRFTETEEKKLCDVSTLTNDWWSPILERKDKSLSLPVKSPLPKSRHIKKEKKETISIGVETEGRIVTFKSHTQVIPPKKSFKRSEVDILSPSRYLLESQKYYNELFSAKRLYAPEVWSLSTLQRNEPQTMLMAPRPPTTWKRRYCKAKRLEECYSPRKMMNQKIPVRTAENALHSSSTINRNYRLGTKLRKPNISHRHFYGKPTLRFKRGHVNLYTRCYVSSEDVSQIGGKNSNSYGTTITTNTTGT